MATLVVIPFTFADVEATETDDVLGADNDGRATRASHDATVIAADLVLHINDAELSVLEASYEEGDTAPLEAAEQQGTNRTHSAFNAGYSNEFLNSRAESSGRTPASTMSNITITKITDERIGSPGIQHKCELKPARLPLYTWRKMR